MHGYNRICTFMLALAGSLGVALPARSAEPAPPPVVASAPDADRALRTPAGATFTAPSAWVLAGSGAASTLTAPEGDARLAVVDAGEGTLESAVAVAWQEAWPGAKVPPVKAVTPQAPRNGWQERRFVDYETSPNERRTVWAQAWRTGLRWTVSLLDASDATAEKRGTQVGLVLSSLRPPGYQRESFAGKRAHPLDAARIATLRAFVEEGMRQLDIPGVGWGLIDAGQVVHEGGLGVRELGRPEHVDADTLFIAASNTKALTTLLLAELVDEKKLRWDQPVVDAYPAFKLGDEQTTRQVLVKHLVCACTGMPRQDMEAMFEFKDASPASSMALLGTMQPTSRFGEVFQYSNTLAAAAGYVGAAIAKPGRELGQAYDEAMREKVFAPLGMRNTTFDFRRALAADHASPHSDDIDGRTVIAAMDSNYSFVPIRPAGGVWTSAHDLSRYVQMELAEGALPAGGRLVSKENLMARRAPQIVVSEDVHYGMGLFVDTHWGVTLVSHGGSLWGYKSNMYWLPEYGVGAVLLMNADSGRRFQAAFVRKLVELMFDAPDESAAILSAAKAQMDVARTAERKRLAVPADPAEAAKLAARYANPALGELGVGRNGANGLTFDFGEWKSEVASRRNDDGSLSFVTIAPSNIGFEFVVTAPSGGKRTLLLRDAQHDYPFVER